MVHTFAGCLPIEGHTVSRAIFFEPAYEFASVPTD
jgi:hypothetical protein